MQSLGNLSAARRLCNFTSAILCNKCTGHGPRAASLSDLARYLLPNPPIPTRWRRRIIALGGGDPTRAICSTLIAEAFQSVHYPVLPMIAQRPIETGEGPQAFEEILAIRDHSLFTPRDFDASPYFQIIKPTIEKGVDFRALKWADDIDRIAST
jgi:hypothetical protein